MKVYTLKNVKTESYIRIIWGSKSSIKIYHTKTPKLGAGYFSIDQARDALDALIDYYGKERFNKLYKLENYTIIKNNEYNPDTLIKNAEKRILFRKLKYG